MTEEDQEDLATGETGLNNI